MKTIFSIVIILLFFAQFGLADQVILDDLIVDGSSCIGFDCVNGESFGADTLRFKEHNLRVHFQDTSNSASFPTNDWRITINDSTNGGRNRFSIDDVDGGRSIFTLEAGASSNSLYVDDAGRVGFGTSAPVVELHTKDGDTPTLRLDQDGTSGWAPQTWDVAGNETNFFIRDVTNGSNLPFRIKPNAPSNSLYIDSSGNIGIGKTSPAHDLDVDGDIKFSGTLWFPDGSSMTSASSGGGTTSSTGNIMIESDTDANGSGDTSISTSGTVALSIKANTQNIGIGTSTPSSSASVNRFVHIAGITSGVVLEKTGVPNKKWDLFIDGAGIFRLYSSDSADSLALTQNGNVGFGTTSPSYPLEMGSGAHVTAGGVWTNGSSKEFKQNIQPLGHKEAVEALKSLKPVHYTTIADPKEHYVGFIAEDVPDIVATNARRGVASMDIVAVLTRVVQEQQRTINMLKKRIKKVELQLSHQ